MNATTVRHLPFHEQTRVLVSCEGEGIDVTIQTKYMTGNDCFQAGRTIVPKGIMIHSTATPGVMAADWFSRWNKSYKAGEMTRQVCVHAFVDDRSVWQYLPWNHRGWHAGGTANNTHIGIEICEPKGFRYDQNGRMTGYNPADHEVYFRMAWKRTVALAVKLCREFGLNETAIIDHTEGNRQGIASAHQDVMHWFARHGESVDSFRRDVRAELGKSVRLTVRKTPDAAPGKLFRVQAGAFSSEAKAKDQLRRLKEAGFDAFIQ
ncbi:N-acetylmuramoyl-L-alanine amidase family 2 [[Bacillus] selenitireducens MLS10]|uniref:N-acetylmuramoyl-L-alanine amidase n=1 Tax=Bacillus selenitireducens (strain ATCC 700615 / DSM 15326 / MLS10) TaxID=439292 RepID=D6XZP5_BACIE|nr:N-acetylmuramoyl-L-alanine amidase family 2 [[Bacillus] selenitireducens MLS10]